MFAIQCKTTKKFFTNGDMANPFSRGNWAKDKYVSFKNATHARNVLLNAKPFGVCDADRWERSQQEDLFDIVRVDGKTFNFMAS